MDKLRLDGLVTLAKRAAKQAGHRVMAYYGGDYAVFSKGIDSRTGDVVTQADHDAQDIILKHLHDPANRDLLKDIAILAEEMDDHGDSGRFEKPYTFLIDPLDGTRGFMDHNGSFAVSIGLVDRCGAPVFGVAYLPAHDELLAGVQGGVTTRNGKVFTFDEEVPGKITLWLSEAEIFPADRNAVWHQLCHGLREDCAIHKMQTVVIGSPVHKGANLVTHVGGSLYVGLPRREKGVSLWDLAAVVPIVTGAGGWVSDIYGEPLELNRRESTYVHHRGFVFASHAALARSVIATFGRNHGGRLF